MPPRFGRKLKNAVVVAKLPSFASGLFLDDVSVPALIWRYGQATELLVSSASLADVRSSPVSLLKKGEPSMTDTAVRAESIVGQRAPRVDALDKVTGRAKYTADLKLPGLLHGAFLRSPHAHARILRIDTSRAEALPGVKAVITQAKLAGRVSKIVDE